MSLTLKAGQDKAWLLTFETGGSPYDLTGCAVYLKVWSDSDDAFAIDKGSSIPMEISIVLTGDANTAIVYFDGADTTTRGGTEARYAVMVETAAGKRYPASNGRVEIEPWVFDT